MNRFKISEGAYAWYIILNVLTFGSFYFVKVLIMKAIIDARNSEVKNVG